MQEKSKKDQPKSSGFRFLGKFRQQRDNRRQPEVEAGDQEEHGALIFTVSTSPHKKEVAQVILNGYNIEQDKSLGPLGAMRSFKIVRGDLWEQWNAQTAVTLAHDNGQETLVKIAALPVDDDSFGLIEFVKSS